MQVDKLIMKTRPLGKAGFGVSELGFGGASIGNLFKALSNSAAEQTIKTAWQEGMRYFDTAAQYGHGLSEVRLGHTLHDYPRSEFVLSTKAGKRLKPALGHPEGDEPWFIDHLPFDIEYDYSYDGIMRCVEDSMQRLSLNFIDIIHLHDLDSKVLGEDFTFHFKQAMNSGIKALEELQRTGFIKAISLGVKESQVCEDALNYGDFNCFMLQGNFTLLDQEAKQSGFLDRCFKKGIGILQAGPFASGILVQGAKKGAKYHHIDAPETVIKKVAKIQSVCNQYDVELPAAALQFALSHPAISSTVTGFRTHLQVMDCIKWLAQPIPSEFWKHLKSVQLIKE